MSERALTRAPTAGWHGKLPSRGDFVSGGAPSGLIEGWRSWAMAGLNASRSDGDAWRAAFLTAPLWRFACAPGFFAAAGGIGVMTPGIDRRGRAFPFVVALEVAGLEDPARALAAGEAWFAGVEAAVLAALDPGLDPAALGVRLPPLPNLAAMPAADGGPRAVFAADGTAGRRIAVDGQPTAALFRALFGLAGTPANAAEGPGGAS